VELTHKLILELTFVRIGIEIGIEIGTMHENNFQTLVQFLKWAN
jgi:hypothetical protein